MAHDSRFKFKSEKQRKQVMALINQRSGGGKVLEGHVNKRNILAKRDETSNLQTNKRRMLLEEKINKPYVVLNESEIQIIKNNLNSGSEPSEEFGHRMNDIIANHPNGVEITEEQNQKGIEYLNRPNIRKQLGERELEILDNIKDFKLSEFWDDNNGYRSYWTPSWRVIANNDDIFEYIGNSEGVQVIG